MPHLVPSFFYWKRVTVGDNGIFTRVCCGIPVQNGISGILVPFKWQQTGSAIITLLILVIHIVNV